MKRIILIFMVTLTLFFMTFTSSAVDDENIEDEDLVSILGDDFFAPDEEVESFDMFCNDPIINSLDDINKECVEEPADEAVEEEQNNGVSTYVIGDRTETDDINLELEGLEDIEIENETDGTGFKNIINIEGQSIKNRAYLYPIIQSRYENFPSDHELYVNMQGSCSDGEYVYYAFYIADKYKDDVTDKYIKVPLEICIVSGYFDENDVFVTTAIRFSGDMLREGGLTARDELKHANGITYNSLHDKLVISCSELGYHNMVYLMDAAYFRGETNVIPTSENYALSGMISAIAYNERYNKYVALVAGTDMYFVYFDSDFNLIGGFNNVSNKRYESNYELSHQGIACDDNYIYATYCELVDNEGTINDEFYNFLVMFDWNGHRKYEINLNFVTETTTNSGRKALYEIEGISILNDRMVLGFNAFWRKNAPGEYRKPYFYQYDMSDLCFNIKYCPDDNVANYVNNNNLRNNTVIYGISTPLLINTHMNNGYKFKGWNLYNPETNKWRYENKALKKTGWYVEGAQPEGYGKIVYATDGEQTLVKQTVPAGMNLLLCATWAQTDKFYVSYSPNDNGSGTIVGSMVEQEMTYGQLNYLNEGDYTKTVNGNPVTFLGWNPYSPEVNKWYYESADKSQRGWYTEGEEPTGFTKVIYTDGGYVRQTTIPGGHIILFALWNEFSIYYDANGQLIQPLEIKMPDVVHKGYFTELNKYEVNSIFPYAGKQTPTGLNGYYQYHVESERWRYYSDTDSSIWLTNSTLPLFTFTGNAVGDGIYAGQHVVFKANWSYT